jgi:anti-sigma factor RsiW
MGECDQIAAMLSEYLDRDLPPETCGAIAAHLETCSQCSEQADALRQTVDMCRSFRVTSRPDPLPAEKHAEMRAAFEKALAELGGASKQPRTAE